MFSICPMEVMAVRCVCSCRDEDGMLLVQLEDLKLCSSRENEEDSLIESQTAAAATATHNQLQFVVLNYCRSHHFYDYIN